MGDLRDALRGLGLDVRGDAASWAALSPCGRYRYALGRSWQDPLFPRLSVLWAAHNPSTATHEQDDPTIRKEIGFSKREGFGSLVKVNMMAWRATDKADLLGLPDPVGPLNDECIAACVAHTDKAIVAWGKINPRLRIHARFGGESWCLGVNGDGSPKHPLYKANDTPLVRWP